MKIEEFKIGKTFYGAAGFLWLCTDKGTRTIAAIRMDPSKASVWFEGPPYNVNELVFDEIDMDGCYTSEIDMLNNTVDHSTKSLHPNYSAKDSLKMVKERVKDNREYYFIKKSMPINNAILKRDRVNDQYQILHPYSMIKDGPSWYIKVFDIFNGTYEIIHEDVFVKFHIAQRSDFEKAIFIKSKK